MSVLFNPMDPAFLRDPYPTFAALRREPGIPRHPGGFYIVSRHAEAAHVLKDAETFSSGAMGGQGPLMSRGADPKPDEPVNPMIGTLISKDPPIHTRHRNIVSRGFTPRRIAALEPRVRAVVDELMGPMARDGRCELIDEFAAPLPVTVIAELLGLPVERRDDFKRWSGSLIVGSTSLDARSQRAQLLEDVRQLTHFLRETIATRSAAPGDDLISVLIHAREEEGVLSETELLSFVTLLLAAGSETTMNWIGNTVIALCQHPEEFAALRADPTRLPAVLEESIRWDSPVQMLMRLTTRDTELAGTQIARGSLVAVLPGSANRDDAQFADGERFDPERDTTGHLSFGFGNHFCLGASLARLEARCALEAILSRFDRLELVDAEPTRHGSFLIRGAKRLPLRLAA